MRAGPTTPTRSARSTRGGTSTRSSSPTSSTTTSPASRSTTTARTRPTRPFRRRRSRSRCIRRRRCPERHQPRAGSRRTTGIRTTSTTAKNANTNDPDKQWIAIDTNPSSPHYGRVYAMWTVFVLNPSVIYESHADARPDGTHTDWSAPQVLPTVSGKRWDTYLLPHVAPDGTVYTTITNNPKAKDFLFERHLPDLVEGRRRQRGKARCRSSQDVQTPTFQNTTFREGIVNTFAVGTAQDRRLLPALRLLRRRLERSLERLPDRLLRRRPDVDAPIRVNDNAGPTEAMQPNLHVAPNGTVTLAFYDRRLPCPARGDPDAPAPASRFDPGTDASPGTPGARSNYCVNTAIQFYTPSLTPIGNNVRLSGAHLGSAALRTSPELHLLSRDVHWRLLRGRVGRRLDLHDVGVDVQLRRREPELPPAADRRKDLNALSRPRSRRRHPKDMTGGGCRPSYEVRPPRARAPRWAGSSRVPRVLGGWPCAELYRLGPPRPRSASASANAASSTIVSRGSTPEYSAAKLKSGVIFGLQSYDL